MYIYYINTTIIDNFISMSIFWTSVVIGLISKILTKLQKALIFNINILYTDIVNCKMLYTLNSKINTTKDLDNLEHLEIAVVIPCYNEEITIGKVIDDFREHIPQANIYVFDNNSTDKTAEIAMKHKAIVVNSIKQGKGNVVQHIAETVEADIYIMVDGDNTYHAPSVQMLVKELITSNVNMVIGTRLSNFENNSFRIFHEFGNHLIAKLISILFSTKVTDVLSGYRVFSREFLKTVPLKSSGFEIETELTLQAITKHFSIKEITTPYGTRQSGSFSKLNTYSDGLLILRAIFLVLKDFKPLFFFTVISVFLAFLSVLIAFPALEDFVLTGYVYHIPRSILAAAIGILSVLSLCVGLILDTISKYHNENFALWRRHLNNLEQNRKIN